jgi:hypothetical protein
VLIVIEVDDVPVSYYQEMQAESDRAGAGMGSFGEATMSLQTANRDVNARIIGILPDDTDARLCIIPL